MVYFRRVRAVLNNINTCAVRTAHYFQNQTDPALIFLAPTVLHVSYHLHFYAVRDRQATELYLIYKF